MEQKPDWAMSARELENRRRIEAGQPPLKSRRWPLVVVIALAAGGGLWLKSQPAPDVAIQTDVATPAFELNPFEYERLARGPLEKTLRVTGNLAPARHARVPAMTGGRIDELLVKPGDRVTRGQIIARLDTTDAQIEVDRQMAAIAATTTQRDLALTRADRTGQLQSRGVTAQATLDAATAELAALEANIEAMTRQLELAQKTLRETEVVSTIDGIVSARPVNAGEMVQPGATVIEVADLSTIEMTAYAPVSAAAHLGAGLKVRVAVEGEADLVRKGELTRISPIAISGARALPVHITLPNPEERLRGGMFATALIITEEEGSSLSVPEESLISDSGSRYVLVVSDGKAQRRLVRTGPFRNAGRIQILEGLSEGDVIVTLPLAGLKDGDAVNLTE